MYQPEAINDQIKSLSRRRRASYVIFAALLPTQGAFFFRNPLGGER